jgi:hypothetical protein
LEHTLTKSAGLVKRAMATQYEAADKFACLVFLDVLFNKHSYGDCPS